MGKAERNLRTWKNRCTYRHRFRGACGICRARPDWMRSRRGADQSKVVRVGQDGEWRNRVGGCKFEGKWGNYMSVLFCLGMHDDMAQVAAADMQGRDIQDARLLRGSLRGVLPHQSREARQVPDVPVRVDKSRLDFRLSRPCRGAFDALREMQ